MSPDRSRKPPTAAQLRDDIDSGRTMDKVAHPDPAAAPLGTDDEAGGNPPTSEQLEEARRLELGRTGRTAAPRSPATRRSEAEQRVDDALDFIAGEAQRQPIPDRLKRAAEKLQKALRSRRS